jgi:hypothetical protein
MQVTENMLQANKNVDGLFSASDVMLDGVLQAAGDANRTGIKILSVDGSKKAVDLVEQGAIVGTMSQFPGKMGPIAVENLLAVLGGKKAADSIPKVIDSGTMVYDKSNLAEARKWAFWAVNLHPAARGDYSSLSPSRPSLRWVRRSAFLDLSNLLNVVRQSSITGICAVGMTFVIVIKGIDLSWPVCWRSAQ